MEAELVERKELKRTDTSSFRHHAIAGSFAGVAEHVSVFPIDTIKTHVQAQRSTTATLTWSSDLVLAPRCEAQHFWACGHCALGGILECRDSPASSPSTPEAALLAKQEAMQEQEQKQGEIEIEDDQKSSGPCSLVSSSDREKNAPTRTPRRGRSRRRRPHRSD